MKPSDIELFTKSSSGTGRDENDKRNSLREAILVDGFNGKTQEFFTDGEYGADWKRVSEAFREGVESLGGEGPTMVKRMGGRKHNYDFLVRRGEEHKVEFKFGGKSVDTLPEYFNPAADKPFHSQLYASFFYKNYLPQIAAMCGVDVPSEDVYMKAIHKNTSKLEFFEALKRCEDDPEIAKRKSRIVNDSIIAFLEKERNNTNLEALTEEFRRSQSGKKFMIYSSDKFYHDKIDDSELVATGVKEIRNGNVLVIRSANPNTEHHMLLRWKNHKGVLFPAWQISMLRAK